jgi:hypothetical protein
MIDDDEGYIVVTPAIAQDILRDHGIYTKAQLEDACMFMELEQCTKQVITLRRLWKLAYEARAS